MKRLFTTISVLFLFTGCSVTKVPTATDGSKSDGTLSYSYNYTAWPFTSYDAQWEDIEVEAKKKCRNWGYSDVESFGGTKKECARRAPAGNCNEWRITKKYQCIE